jgi:hypothetical protein
VGLKVKLGSKGGELKKYSTFPIFMTIIDPKNYEKVFLGTYPHRRRNKSSFAN